MSVTLKETFMMQICLNCINTRWRTNLNDDTSWHPRVRFEQYEVIYWCINAHKLNLNDNLMIGWKKHFSIIRFFCQITWLHNSFIIYLMGKISWMYCEKHPFYFSLLDQNDANVTWWSTPWKIFHRIPSNDWPWPMWSNMALLNTQICSEPSSVRQLGGKRV